MSGRSGDDHATRRKFICSTTASAIAGVTTGAIVTTLHGTEAAVAANAIEERGPSSVGSLAYPFSSQRQYRHLTLANGLRVVLVSDKKNLREGASLSSKLYGAQSLVLKNQIEALRLTALFMSNSFHILLTFYFMKNNS